MAKLKLPRDLNLNDNEMVREYLLLSLTPVQMASVLADYLIEDNKNEKKDKKEKIKITNEQFEQYFHIIKTREKGE